MDLDNEGMRIDVRQLTILPVFYVGQPKITNPKAETLIKVQEVRMTMCYVGESIISISETKMSP